MKKMIKMKIMKVKGFNSKLFLDFLAILAIKDLTKVVKVYNFYGFCIKKITDKKLIFNNLT